MSTTPDNTATTWRDLADQLTPEQIAWAEKLERDALGDPAEVAEVLLDAARDHARKNLTDRMAFGHLPLPAGAVEVQHWEEADGRWHREFTGTERHHDRGLDVIICGAQQADGSVQRHANVYASDSPPDCEPADLRAMAALLVDAADELDFLADTAHEVRR